MGAGAPQRTFDEGGCAVTIAATEQPSRAEPTRWRAEVVRYADTADAAFRVVDPSIQRRIMRMTAEGPSAADALASLERDVRSAIDAAIATSKGR